MNDAHLSPERFVDLLENAPVDAGSLQHLEGCARCASELRELRETLALVRGESEPLAVKDRTKARNPVAWLAAAALVLLALASLSKGVLRDSPAAPGAVLLPPAESDEGFQLLVDVSRELGETTTLDAVESSVGLEPAELAELTDEERRQVISRLASEIDTSESSS